MTADTNKIVAINRAVESTGTAKNARKLSSNIGNKKLGKPPVTIQ